MMELHFSGPQEELVDLQSLTCGLPAVGRIHELMGILVWLFLALGSSPYPEIMVYLLSSLAGLLWERRILPSGVQDHQGLLPFHAGHPFLWITEDPLHPWLWLLVRGMHQSCSRTSAKWRT